VATACAGGANSGTITTTATAGNGGTLTYTINGVTDLDGNQTALANNGYTVIVTEAPSGCTNTETVVVNCNCPTITVAGAATLCQSAAAASTYTQSGGAAGGTWLVTPVGAGTITASGVFAPSGTYAGNATINYTVAGCVGAFPITINVPLIPVFAQIAPICNGVTSIPGLLASSNNGIPGTWNPATVSNTATGTYTFTPNANVCATPGTLTVTVNPKPTLSVVAACAGSANSGTITTTAAAMSGGTLSYTINNVADLDGNQTNLANNSYTVVVTESPSGCTNSQTVLVSCSCPTITLSGAAAICQTAAAASAYTQSGGAAGGTWTVTPAGAGAITAGGIFTPNTTFSGAAIIRYTVAGCVGVLNITVNAATSPTFTQVGPFCSGATIPALPTSSTNSTPVTGTWSPAINNTATTTYVFSPSAGQCATSVIMTIVVNTAPTLSVVSACTGGANSGTITTTATAGNVGGTLTYTINGVADLDGNQTSLANNTYTVVVTQAPGGCTNSQTVLVNCGCPTITVSGADTLCQNTPTTAYTQSGGATGGLWTVAPALAGVITAGGVFTPNPTFAGAATITYTVAGCAGLQNLTIKAPTLPTFAQVGPFCAGANIPALPNSSTNATPIVGTWLPAINNTTTTTYTFTPSSFAGANNLVVNGDFSAGNTGFTSAYSFIPNAGTNGVQKAYGINTDANNWFQFFAPCTATGTASGGNYMIVDGSTGNGGNDLVWGQNIPVLPNLTYTFSFWLQTIALPNAAQIEVSINGAAIGTSLAPNTNCDWKLVTFTWNSGASTTANIAMFDKTILNNGNDFGLDDISFYPNSNTCIAEATMTIIVNDQPTINVLPICNGGQNTGILSTTADAANFGTLSYTINGVADADGDQTGLANNDYTVIVTESPSGCTNSQTVTINCGCPPITISGDTTLCQGAGATNYIQTGGNIGTMWTVTPLSAGTINATGSFTPNPAFAGVATITYAEGTCVGTLDVTINPGFTANLVVSNPLCQGDMNGSIVIVTPNTNPPYLSNLNGNDIGGTTLVQDLDTGNYTLQIVDALGCTWDSTFTLIDPLPFTLDLGPDLLVEYGDEITLNATTDIPLAQIDTITWSPAASFTCLPGQICAEQTLMIDSLTPSQITAIAIDTNGCIATDVLNIAINGVFSIYVPNAFAPSSNTDNRIFTIYGSPNVLRVKSFNIYDRWGTLMFRDANFAPNDPARGWDGTYKGKTLAPGVYVYTIVVDLANGSSELKTGDITIVR
jgi:gliding motility-associated-like protein